VFEESVADIQEKEKPDIVLSGSVAAIKNAFCKNPAIERQPV
jgi:hypothetical protein